MKFLVLGLLLASILPACSDSDTASDTTTGTTQGTLSSCDLSADLSYCLDFAATAPKDEAKGNCASEKATLGYNGVLNETGPCPTATRVGSCAYVTASGVATTYRYYSAKFTTASAETNCNNLPGTPGTFTAN